ncbi:MAG: hypothetical protein NTY05_06660 [Rhodocyclales bacterium]|nr:hypothetical protein [Rhodocyclales bacterium]
MVTRVTKHVPTQIALSALMALVGCATPAQPERMVPRQLAAQTLGPSSTLRGAIFLAKVGGGEETNPAWFPKSAARSLRKHCSPRCADTAH